jgi:hypothetical protein
MEWLLFPVCPWNMASEPGRAPPVAAGFSHLSEASRVAHELIKVSSLAHPSPTEESSGRTLPLNAKPSQKLVMLPDKARRLALIHPLTAAARPRALKLVDPLMQPRKFLFDIHHQSASK